MKIDDNGALIDIVDKNEIIILPISSILCYQTMYISVHSMLLPAVQFRNTSTMELNGYKLI
jgi:hypothetical protein